AGVCGLPCRLRSHFCRPPAGGQQVREPTTMNPAAEGTTYPAVPFTVEPSRVAAFRALFGISEGVPPTFVTAAEFAAFPHAGGDQNPLHKDDAFARSSGFPGIIAHGMFTMGHMAAAVVAWAGEPDAVLAVSAQFRAPVFMGETIVAGGQVRSIEDRPAIALLETWVRVERDGRTEWPVKRGEARVRL